MSGGFIGPPRHDTGTSRGLPGSNQIGITLTRNRIFLTAQKKMTELTAVRNDIWLNESPVTVVAGATRTYTVTYEGASSVSSPSAIAYKDGTDVSATVFPSGSITASGTTVTMKPLTALSGGEVYVIAITATVDGNTDVRKLKVIAANPSDE